MATRRRTPVWEALTALAALALYARTVAFGWVYDDQMEVARNTFVTSLAHLKDIFTTTVWAGSGMETYLYRPLALVTYALNYQLSGAQPWSYHLVNVLLHAGVAVLVVRVGRSWGLPAVGAGMAGLLFALHPVHVEAVAPVFGRKDLLATGALLAMALTHRRALARGAFSWGLPLLLYLAAMFSKEVGVVGIALVASQDLWLEREGRGAFLRRRDVPLAYAGYLMVAALYLLIRTRVTGGLGIPDTSFYDNPLVTASWGSRMATAWMVVARGFALLALPLHQSPDYSFDAIPAVQTLLDPRLMASLVFLAALGAGLVHRRLRGTPVPLAAAWYAVGLLPVSNLVILSGTIFAERLLYLPSVAFCIVAGGGIAWLHRARPTPAVVVAALVGVGLTVQTFRYTGAWTDDVTLFRHAVQVEPRSTKANHKLGEELLRRGDVGPALRALHRALAIAPENVYAAETLQQARTDVAARYLAPAASGAPLPQDPDVLYALGAVALERADSAVALDAVTRAVEVEPGLARGWLTLATLQLGRGEEEPAAVSLRNFLAHAGDRFPDEQRQARALLERLSRR